MTKHFLRVATFIWIAAVILGIGVLAVYEHTPGPAVSVPSQWPAQSRITRAADVPTLVMFAHPECPCTRASIEELAVLMAQCQNRLKAHVVFLYPEGSDDDWLHTDLWRSAQAIPGVVVEADGDGNEASDFRATTSGQVVLYDTDGKLLFRGGITSSRGNYGDNAGISAILSLLAHKTASSQTPVFGCSLLDPPSVATKRTSVWIR